VPDPEALVASLDERIECRAQGDAIRDFELQFVGGDNEALHYRGNPIHRRKIWLQDGDPNEGVRVYSYTGWQAPVAFATSDWNGDEQLGGICGGFNTFLDGTDFAPANHAIVTAYDDQTSGIGYHYDKTHTLDPNGVIAVVKLGAARRFEVRTRLPPLNTDGMSETECKKAKDAHAKAQEAVEPLFSETLQAGTLVLMTNSANLATQHAVPMTQEPVGLSGSIVFRSVTRVDQASDLRRKRDKVLANRQKKLAQREARAASGTESVESEEDAASVNDFIDNEAAAMMVNSANGLMLQPRLSDGDSSSAPAPSPVPSAPTPAPAPASPPVPAAPGVCLKILKLQIHPVTQVLTMLFSNLFV
jgi:hypothetical protein